MRELAVNFIPASRYDNFAYKGDNSVFYQQFLYYYYYSPSTILACSACSDTQSAKCS